MFLLKKLDTTILLIVASLVAIGTIAIYGATAGTRLDGLHINNLILFGALSIPMLLVALLDYRILIGRWSYALYAAGIGMLLLVKFRGEVFNGAVRWLSIGQFQFQPSELAKIFTILLAAHLLQKRSGEKLRLIKDLCPIFIIFIIPTVLIMDQPDLGTALVFVGILLGLLWMGNIRIMYMLLFIGSVSLVIGSVLWLYYANHDFLAKFVAPHQMARIQTFLDPASDPDKSWHVMNAKYAIGSGGLNGDTGYYLQHGFIPYAYSDSIYVVIAERYGFLGSAVLLLLYFSLLYRMVIIGLDNKELSASYIVIGLISMLVFQVFVNIGMHIGLLPLTGISLPFISYGGSSLLTNMIAIGLVLSVKMHQQEATLEETE